MTPGPARVHCAFDSVCGCASGRSTLLDPTSDPFIEHESERYLLGRADAEENARRKKHDPSPKRASRGIDVPFDPAGALVDALVGRRSDG